jgi:hypothetical protein
MLRKLRSNLTYANVMATVAVFLALGGGAIAAKSLKRNSVGTKQLKGAAVKTNKIANNAVTNPKLAGNAVNSAKIQDGTVGLADSANSLHQKCESGTVYVIGTCIDQASQSPTTGDDYPDAEQACQARGGRLASAAELASFVDSGFGTIPTPLFSWAYEAVGGGSAMIVSNTGGSGTAAGASLHDYRCAFNPLG